MEDIRSEPPEAEDWRRALEAAKRVKEMAPWRFMEEIDIFGVEDPVSHDVAFASVMGMLGEHLAVAAYLGAEALYEFWEILETDLDVYPEAVMEPRQIQVSFEKRETLTERDREWIARLKLRFRGQAAWPMFRSYRAGFVPSGLDASELRLLTVVLQQVVEVAPRFERDRGLFETDDPETYFVRVPTRRGDVLEWNDAVRRIPRPERTVRVAAYDDLVGLCRVLEAAEEDAEVDFFWLPAAIADRERAYYPYALLVVGAKTGLVSGFRMLRVETSFEDMWGEVPRSFLQLLLEAGRVPRRVLVRSPRLANLIWPLEGEIPITVAPVEDLPGLDRAKGALIDAMTSP